MELLFYIYFGYFLTNLGENTIRQNTDFQLQYKLNDTEQHSEMFIYAKTVVLGLVPPSHFGR